ncbi:hypothetical protein [Pedosphaera parvula]|uniref:Uncharacterized protein n=1 Tax=Pedosphaera parvula (strain Ellin514) TaxID=320771 RepID=B9XD97_PEDPL|nr:hypothetical protein [Pedosphaera parvula]EEF62043.1 hypothetical protein Cflav_PD6318 [Pedosphaera parvula Ellin514]
MKKPCALEAISQTGAAASKHDTNKMKKGKLYGETGDLLACPCVVRQSQPHYGGCSLLTPWGRPKSLPAPSAPVYEMASSGYNS